MLRDFFGRRGDLEATALADLVAWIDAQALDCPLGSRARLLRSGLRASCCLLGACGAQFLRELLFGCRGLQALGDRPSGLIVMHEGRVLGGWRVDWFDVDAQADRSGCSDNEDSVVAALDRDEVAASRRLVGGEGLGALRAGAKQVKDTWR